MTDEVKNELTDVEVVYLGQRESNAGKPSALFANSTALTGDPVRTAGWFSAKKAAHLIVGGVYTTKGRVDDGGVQSLVLSSLRFVRRCDHADVAMWEIADRAFRDTMLAAAQVRKIQANPAAHEELRELRRMYAVAGRSVRPAFELAILKMIRE